MLRFLSVRHLAVIDHLEVEFEPGLNVLTGETGAGKSILVEAIDLLVGGRASADLVRTGQDLATIQAVFDRTDGREVIVRREVSAQGRSRAFIDDALATTAALRELGVALLDLHGQHEHQSLRNPAEHLSVLDAFAAHGADVDQVGQRHDAWRSAAAALDRTRLDEREKRARIEMARFQIEEIDRIAPAAGEDEQLALERAVLANADRLDRLTAESYAAVYDGEGAAIETLAGVWKRLDELVNLDPRFEPFLDLRDDVKAKLEDLSLFLRDYRAGLDASTERLQAAEDRLAALERLKRKYGPALDDVLARRAALQDELESLDASEERAARLEAAERESREQFQAAARDLSARRQGAAGRLNRVLAEALAELAMPSSRVDVRVTPRDQLKDWHRGGLDAVEILISPNPGEELRPLARIASGGELSRIMLALRTLATPDEPGRTVIFDEVDAGIGGAAADAVGARLQTLARQYQVLCITHLPQIAARAGTHLQVAKEVRRGRTVTTLTRLDMAGREQEIARMIAGAQVTPKVLASAKEMLGRRQKSEAKPKGESPDRPTMAKAKGRRRA
jgi:DNA repair protein RecN (Recombination protein N)